MTVLDHMKAAGYDPNAARNADDLRRMGAGTMECESIQLRTFRCRPYQYEGEMLARSEFIRSTISSHEITPSFSNGIS